MASLTPTYDNGTPDYALGRVSGTFTTTDNEGESGGSNAVDQIVLFPTSVYLTSFNAVCQSGPASIRAQCNVNSAGTATNGTVLIETNTVSDLVFRFNATFLGS